MKQFLYTGLLLCLAIAGNAQQQYPTTLSNAGNSSSNGGILLESSVGGLAVTTINAPAFMYTQGFLQPDAGFTTAAPPFINDVALSSGSGIDNAGTTFINGGVILEFTTGEFASITHSSGNNMITQGILQPYNTVVVVPVTGLDLAARRTAANTVSLDWKTLQEFNNKGFHIERRFENENDFTTIGYVATAAPGGNSTFPLFYQQADNNSFTGTTFYRIRQEDTDGSISYSPVRSVNGSSNTIAASLKAWPIPASGPVSVLVTGLATADRLLVFDMNGRLVQQQNIKNDVVVKLYNLTSGTYIVRLAENKGIVQKIIVQ